MELSVNFLVGLIIGLILFAFGLGFLARIVGLGEETSGLIPDSIKYEAERCVGRGDKVCLVNNKEEARPGDDPVFYLVLHNTLSDETDIAPYLEFSIVQYEDKTTDDVLSDIDDWTPTLRTYTLEKGSYEIVQIPISVPLGTDEGQYVFNVHTCFNDDEYTTENDKCKSFFSQKKDRFASPRQFTVDVQ